MLIGLLHPGMMGAAIGAQLTAAGHDVAWCPAGRSARTVKRAAEAGLRAVDTLAELLAAAETVLSVVPPANADEVAREVGEAGFSGVYVDANAISPHRMAGISADLTDATGATVVDGAIIGPPPGGSATARIYLSGPAGAVDGVYALFEGGAAQPRRVGERIGTASALKMAYGSFQKASRALAAVSHALADDYGVTEQLLAEAADLGANALGDRAYFPGAAARAWRWAPEMAEAAESFRALGLPDDLALGAAEVFRRWAGDKDAWEQSPEDALWHLRASPDLSA